MVSGEWENSKISNPKSQIETANVKFIIQDEKN
jgi:hypothetical protein